MSLNRASSDRQNEATRAAILDAALAVLTEPEAGPFSFTGIAKRAEVSERTVFRHFASQQALCEALTPRVSARLDDVRPPDHLDALPDYVARLYAICDDNAGLVHALLHTEAGRAVLRPARQERIGRLVALVKAAHPDAEPARARRVAATVRYVASGAAWDFYRNEAGLSLKEATLAATEVITAALAALASPRAVRARDGAPRKRRGSR